MVEGEDQQEIIVGPDPNRLRAALHVRREVAVREHRALLASGCSRGVDERRDVVILRVVPVVGPPLTGGLVGHILDELIVVEVLDPAAVDREDLVPIRQHDRVHVGDVRLDIAQQRVVLGIAEQQLGARIAQDVRHLLLLQFCVHRHGGRRHARDAEVNLRPFGRVLAENGDAVAGFDAEAREDFRDAADLREEFVVGYGVPAFLALVAERDSVTALLDRLGEKFLQGHWRCLLVRYLCRSGCGSVKRLCLRTSTPNPGPVNGVGPIWNSGKYSCRTHFRNSAP